MILATPNTQHEEQVRLAAEAGKQVFCEKPLALTRAAAERIVDHATRAGIVLGVGHERRFEPTMEEVQRLVLSDAVYYGQVEYSPSVLIDVATLTGTVSRALGTD